MTLSNWVYINNNNNIDVYTLTPKVNDSTYMWPAIGITGDNNFTTNFKLNNNNNYNRILLNLLMSGHGNEGKLFSYQLS